MWQKLIEKIQDAIWCWQRVDELEAEVARIKQQQASPRYVIEAALKRGINWYDWAKLEKESEKINYYRDIQEVLNNEAFANEINHYLSDLVEEIAASDADTTRDKMLRYSINGVKCLMERLADIPDPTPPKEEEPDDEEANQPI
jgi:hypothetical protein